ncbi:MAG: hypothetical protein AMS24_04120 [Chlamydiae bacterium SM23_39]|nr:MAG: hypothetical protein AMS24_04120 [Chlamydiae bacterium SM23_39]
MTIAVAGGKGGTGKSMVATSLAFLYAKKKETFLIDLDVECPNDHLILNINREKKELIYQTIPKWNFDICRKCGKCALACKQKAISFVPKKYPAFVKDVCIGCKACFLACPYGAIVEDRKIIGNIYEGKNCGINLISGELKIGELASGEIVSSVRKYSDKLFTNRNSKMVVIDTAAGIGCPVIASIIGSDYLITVTEPTPSALHDLKRIIYLGKHFNIPIGIVINKYDLDKKFCKRIEQFAEEENILVICYIPYHKNFVKASLKKKVVLDIFPKYIKIFEKMIKNIKIHEKLYEKIK